MNYYVQSCYAGLKMGNTKNWLGRNRYIVSALDGYVKIFPTSLNFVRFPILSSNEENITPIKLNFLGGLREVKNG